ncbi:hypothetical protein IWX90DRAFT_255086 [Phyllosticta citrichinensis]|uniref:Uncharacterized protein n=1 Tax=Phyllosticta citrichinensis TaxID=1130410 RepID=A0ABR1XRK8_9PEZI
MRRGAFSIFRMWRQLMSLANGKHRCWCLATDALFGLSSFESRDVCTQASTGRSYAAAGQEESATTGSSINKDGSPLTAGRVEGWSWSPSLLLFIHVPGRKLLRSEFRLASGRNVRVPCVKPNLASITTIKGIMDPSQHELKAVGHAAKVGMARRMLVRNPLSHSASRQS